MNLNLFDKCEWCKTRTPAIEIRRIRFAGRVLFVCEKCTESMTRSTPLVDEKKQK